MKKQHIAHSGTKIALCNSKRKARFQMKKVIQLIPHEVGSEKSIIYDRDIVINENDTRLCKMCLALFRDDWVVRTKNNE